MLMPVVHNEYTYIFAGCCTSFLVKQLLPSCRDNDVVVEQRVDTTYRVVCVGL